MVCSNCQNTCGCTCSQCCSDTEVECNQVCASLIVTNSWNVPSCEGSAVLSIPGLETVLIGSYIWNPTYGWFRITAFDSVNGQITVLNECLDANAAPGTVVPAGTLFVFGAPPAGQNVTYSGRGTGSNYVMTAVSAPLTFGADQASITLGSPGTYLLISHLTIVGNGVTIAAQHDFYASLRRQNNTPADIAPNQSVDSTAAVTLFTGTFFSGSLEAAIYTTANVNDLININAYYTGAAPSAGTFEVGEANIVAVKLY